MNAATIGKVIGDLQALRDSLQDRIDVEGPDMNAAYPKVR